MNGMMRLKYVLAAMVMLPGAALADPVNLSYLTHWAPETVAKLEEAARRYSPRIPTSR